MEVSVLLLMCSRLEQSMYTGIDDVEFTVITKWVIKLHHSAEVAYIYSEIYIVKTMMLVSIWWVFGLSWLKCHKWYGVKCGKRRCRSVIFCGIISSYSMETKCRYIICWWGFKRPCMPHNTTNVSAVELKSTKNMW